MIHLHAHTRFSVSDGLASPDELAQAATGGVLAITDHNTLGGAVKHQIACDRHGVTPVFGVDLDVLDQNRLTLLAQNKTGYKNLIELIRLERRGWDDLDRHSEGIIAMSGDLKGAIPQSVLSEDVEALRAHTSKLRVIYGDRFYLEKINHGLPEQEKVCAFLDKLSRNTGIPAVTTNDVHYLKPEDAVAHAVMICDKLNRSLTPARIEDIRINGAWMTDLECPIAREIAQRCHFRLEVDPDKPYLPAFTNLEGFDTEEEFLWHLARKGLSDRLDGVLDAEYTDRLTHEYQIICDMGFAGYFLIVWDFIKQARIQGIPVGPGRGSGGGSLVSYCLNITDFDPLEYGLLFERFLNPERVSMPDFDIDFCIERRDEIFSHVRRVYGKDNVAGIGTYGENRPRSAWDNTGRIFGVKAARRQRIANQYLPESADSKTLKDILDGDDLEALFKDRPQYRQVFELAERIEGTFRNKGKHAGGVIIADDRLTNYAPIRADDEGVFDHVVEFQMEDAEKIGLVKFDFLGLAELTVLERVSKQVGIDVHDIPLDDAKTFELIGSGNTLGTFQMGSTGFQELMSKMKPWMFSHIIAAVALYRPGPKNAGMLDKFVDRMHGREEVDYLHDALEPILSDTYGVILYQEQIMHIAQQLADYTLGGADILRRGIGKKKRKVIEAEKPKFIDGVEEHGVDREIGEELWDQIETFAEYGFNKCLVGDTQLERAGANQHSGRYLTVKELYDAQSERMDNGRYAPYAQKIRAGRMRILQYCPDGRIRPGNVVKVHENGTREVFEVLLSDGRSVEATANHRFLTDQGYEEVQNIEVGDLLIVRSNKEGYQKQGIDTSRAKGVSYQTSTPGFDAGENNPSYIDGRTRALKEAQERALARSGWGCEFCACEDDGRFEFAHLRPLEHFDFDFVTYNSTDNIAHLCNSCHKKLDYEKGERRPAWSKGKPSTTSEVVSIRCVGEKMTYDVEMADPYHNFMANGIVSHNSHSTGYGLLAYWTAYFKAHFPAAFLAAQMHVRRNDFDKLSDFIHNAREMGIEVKDADVRHSPAEFWGDDSRIWAGINTIKGFNDETATVIADAEFDSLMSLLETIDLKPSELSMLAEAGALDDLLGITSMSEACQKRADIVEQAKALIKNASKYAHTHGQAAMFSLKSVGMSVSWGVSPPWSPFELLELERQRLGRYRTDHPSRIARMKYYKKTATIEMWQQKGEPQPEDHEFNKRTFCLVVVVFDVHKIINSNDEEMAFLRVEDETGEYDVTVFSDQCDIKAFEAATGPQLIKVQPNFYNGKWGLVFRRMTPMEELL